MVNFESFYQSLTSDEIWFELLRHYKPETIRKASEKVFASLVADRLQDVRPMKENRKHVYNILVQNPGDKPKVDWTIQALEKLKVEKKEEQEWKPLFGEERAKRLAEWLDKVKGVEMQSAVPRLTYSEIAKEGGWERKKEAPYPITSPMEVYVKERHIEYIKQNYDPRTAQPLPTWIPESDFNVEYDSRNMEGYTGL
jgi:hypothetical protein